MEEQQKKQVNTALALQEGHVNWVGEMRMG
jgi:hypothetical protein